MPERVLIVAARNEEERIGATLDALRGSFPDARLIVADDASTDSTRERALARGAWLISRRRPHGKGANVGAAVEAALSEFGDEAVVLLCDADLGGTAGELAALTDSIEAGRCDLAVAAFADPKGGGFGLTLGYARRAVERRCGTTITAPLSGQRALRISALRRLLPFADGWGLEVGMTIDAVRAGCRVEEIELPLAHRATGRTPAGFLHRARQMRDIRRVARERADSLPPR